MNPNKYMEPIMSRAPPGSRTRSTAGISKRPFRACRGVGDTAPGEATRRGGEDGRCSHSDALENLGVVEPP